MKAEQELLQQRTGNRGVPTQTRTQTHRSLPVLIMAINETIQRLFAEIGTPGLSMDPTSGVKINRFPMRKY